MHLIVRREIVDWSDMSPSDFVDHTPHIACDSCPATSVAWMNVAFAISVILNLLVGAIIWRTPMFRGIIYFVLQQAVQNTIRFFLSQRRVGSELRVDVEVDPDLQEDRGMLEVQRTSELTVHYDAGSNCLISDIGNPPIQSCNESLDSSTVLGVRMSVVSSSMDREFTNTSDSLTVACESNQGYKRSIPG